jgi:hypothetical protein
MAHRTLRRSLCLLLLDRQGRAESRANRALLVELPLSSSTDSPLSHEDRGASAGSQQPGSPEVCQSAMPVLNWLFLSHWLRE